MKIGYARTSTTDQVAGIEKQIEDLRAYGCASIFAEHVSAVAEERPEFEAALLMLEPGDTLVVTTMSRLCRATRDLGEIQERLERLGAGLEIMDLRLDTNTAIGRMTLTIIAAVAQMERELMRERQAVGVAKAQAEGRYKGRSATKTTDTKWAEVQRLMAKHPNLNKEQLAMLAGMSRMTLHRLMVKYDTPA